MWIIVFRKQDSLKTESSIHREITACFNVVSLVIKETYDNEEIIKKMVLSQGFQMKDGELQKPEDGEIKLTVPTGLIPYCPRCGKPMSMNLRSDQTFVEDEGWHWAAERYEKFIQDHKKQKIVFLELGVGYNTPGIIKYPFWQMTNTFQHAFYVCLNQGEAYAPEEIRKKILSA